MEQEQEDDRRPTDSEQPTKKQRLNRPRLTPLINPNDIMNGLPANQDNEQQQAGRKRKRRSRKAKKSRRKSRKSSRRYRR
jgi:hypothetical protein